MSNVQWCFAESVNLLLFSLRVFVCVTCNYRIDWLIYATIQINTIAQNYRIDLKQMQMAIERVVERAKNWQSHNIPSQHFCCL